MIEMINDTITIHNWGKHQTLDKLEANKQYMRQYMKEYRKKQRAITNGENDNKVYGKLNDKTNFNLPDKELNKDKEIENKDKIDIDKNDNYLDTQHSEQSVLDCEKIINSFNFMCKSLPSVKRLTEKRKNQLLELNAILGDVTFEDLFNKVESSDFLTGRKTAWKCSFDWIIQSEHALKIIEGNYDNRSKTSDAHDFSDCSKYQNISMEG